jgi:hypothetical protein
MSLDGLFRNPVTYGRTPRIEAYRIATCPVCCRPAVSAIGLQQTKEGRTIEYRCVAGHPWRTSWSGVSQMIHREAAE